MSDDDTTMNVNGLEGLLKALKAKMPIARIGILGGGARSGSNGITNAEVGAAHEYGTSKMPQRSFLRVPISENLDKRLQNSNALNEETLKQVIKDKTVVPWLTKVAIIAENIVLDAFDSNGFGKWPAWKGNYVSNTGMILVNSQQLRNSITYEVAE